MKNDYDNKYYLHYYQFNVSDADNTGMGMCWKSGAEEVGKGQIMKGFTEPEGAKENCFGAL